MITIINANVIGIRIIIIGTKQPNIIVIIV